MSEVLFPQHIKFAFERGQDPPRGRRTTTMGAPVQPQGHQTCFLPRAPSNHVTPLVKPDSFRQPTLQKQLGVTTYGRLYVVNLFKQEVVS